MNLRIHHLFLLGILAPWFSAAAESPVTFNDHVGPLLHDRCASCHRPGEAGPFPLLTYEEVSKKARTIQRVLDSGYMPPWQPSDTGVRFQHDRRLSAGEIATFHAWIEAGKPRGVGPAPEPPSFPGGWLLGEPDIVLTMEEAFPVPAEGPDIYRNFALKLGLPEDQWVRAVEMRPGARGVVHHSLFFLDTTGTAVAKDGEDGVPGFRGMGFQRAGSLGGYVPGTTPHLLPEGLAMALPKGADLVLSTHFHPSGKPTGEKSSVGIYLADAPPRRTLANIQVPPAFGRGEGIDIPAGETSYEVRDHFTLPVDVDAISVGGHAHYICEEQKMTARFPDGSERVLFHIEDWDLNWQDRYFFAEPIRLPAGTVLESWLRYDNSADNPDNPFSPPRQIRWGHESTDEMGSITLMVTPAEDADPDRLTKAARLQNIEVLGAVLRDPRGTAALALARRIQGLDANRDGRIQSAEIPPRQRSKALQYDANGDGQLEKRELENLLEAVRAGGL